MRACKRTVKRLDSEFLRVVGESLLIHERYSTEATNVGVVQSSAVIQIEAHRRVVELSAMEMPVVDEESACESRLHDEPVTAVEIDHHQLGASPAAHDGRVADSSGERAGTHLAQHVGFAHRHFLNFPPTDRTVEIARDGLGLR